MRFITKNRKLGFVQKLRGFAIINVFLYHIDPKLVPNGFLGVDIFFVISGFIVTYVHVNYLEANAEIDLIDQFLHFWRQRVKRILPPLLFCSLVSTIVFTIFLPYHFVSGNALNCSKYVMLGVSNICFYNTLGTYFGFISEYNPFLHTWSLSIELQFYLFYPLVIFLVMYCRKNNQKTMGYVIINSLLAYSLYNYFSNPDVDIKFFFLRFRIWEFLSGVLIYYIATDVPAFRALPEFIFLLIGSFFSIYSLYFLGQDNYLNAIFTVFSSMVFLYFGLYEADLKYKNIFTEALNFIGDISYSLYLWHWPIIVFLKWTIGDAGLLFITVSIILSFFAAYLSHIYIENGFERSLLLQKSQNYTYYVFMAWLIYSAVNLTEIIIDNRDIISMSVTKDFRTWEARPWHLATIPEPMISGTHRLTLKSKETRIFVIGDSHAANYSTMFQHISEAENLTYLMYQKPGCGIVDFRQHDNFQCDQFSEDTINAVKKKSHFGDIVFMPSLRIERLLNNRARPLSQVEIVRNTQGPFNPQSQDEAFLRDYKIISDLVSLGLIVVLEAPGPVFFTQPFMCSDWYNKINNICEPGFFISREFIQKYREGIVSRMQYISTKIKNVYIWDPLPSLCDTKYCYSVNNTGPVYRDSDHLTALGNEILFQPFRSFLYSILNTKIVEPFSGRIDFTEKFDDVFLFGFSDVEAGGRWSYGTNSIIKFYSGLPGKINIKLKIVGSFLGGMSDRILRITIGDESCEFILDGQTQVVNCDFINENHSDAIKLATHNLYSPRDIGLSDDTRLLGIRLSEVIVSKSP